MSARRWNRRSFLQSVGWIGAIVFVRPFSGVRQSGAYPALEPALFFRNVKSAAVLGRAYLEEHEDERSVAHLHALIWSECDRVDGERAPGGPAELRAVIDARQRRDFANGETVLLDGWVVSKTEARLFALAALS